MKLAFISDLHANVRLPFARVSDGGISSDRLEDVCSVLRQAATRCLEEGVEGLYILGDLFDKKHPDGATLVAASRVLREMADQGLAVNILPGNHDAVDRDGRLYTLQFLDALKVPGIRVLGHEAIEVASGVRLHALPWLPDSRALKRMREMDKGCEGDRNILLFHQSVVGAIGDTGWVSDEGLPTDAHDGFDLGLSGHYHKPQKHPWGIYLGSPLQFRFSDEEHRERGMWVVDVTAKTLKPEMVQLDAPLFGTCRVGLEAGQTVETLLDIEDALGGDALDYLRIIIEGDPQAIVASHQTLMEWKSNADRYGLRRIKVDQRPDRATPSHRMTVNPSLSPERIAAQYANRHKQPKDIIDLGTDIIREVTR